MNTHTRSYTFISYIHTLKQTDRKKKLRITKKVWDAASRGFTKVAVEKEIPIKCVRRLALALDEALLLSSISAVHRTPTNPRPPPN